MSFNRSERAVLNLAREMTRDVRVDNTTFAAVRAELGSDRGMVESVGVIAGYNLFSRFLVALEIEPSQAPTA